MGTRIIVSGFLADYVLYGPIRGLVFLDEREDLQAGIRNVSTTPLGKGPYFRSFTVETKTLLGYPYQHLFYAYPQPNDLLKLLRETCDGDDYSK